MKNEESNLHFFAKEVSRKICGNNDQNCVILCTGAMGSGKSWTMLELSRLISIYIAEKLGGSPLDYFDLKDHVGIMTMQEIEKIYEHMDTHKHHIYVVDDAGASINSRRFMSDENVAQNDRLQVMRPNSNVIIYTTPNKRLVDVAVRFLSGYQIYMREPLFHLGMTTCDIRRISVQDDGKLYYPFLQDQKGCKYKLHIFSAPPKEWTDEYRKRRQTATEELTRQARETIEESMKPKETKESKKQAILKGHSDWMNGLFGEISWKNWCITHSINPDYANNVVSKNS